MKISGIDQAERLLAAIREQDAVADDFAVEIDVRFRDGGDIRAAAVAGGREPVSSATAVGICDLPVAGDSGGFAES